MKFSCEPCNYATNIKFSFEKHEKTAKHIEKVNIFQMPALSNHTVINKLSLSNHDEIHKLSSCNHEEFNKDVSSKNEYKCPDCDNIYTNRQNLSRHKKTCTQKQVMIDQHEKRLTDLKEMLMQKDSIFAKDIAYKDDIIKSKDDIIAKEIAYRDDIIKSKDDTIKSKDETILTLTHENKNLKTMLNSAGTLVEKSISSLAYINKNYIEAPALEMITDVPSLHVDLTEERIVETIIHKYKNGKLISFIGDLLLKTYKKTDPAKQSIWTSDTDRLTYVVRTLLGNKSYHWKIDKKGIDTAKCIVKPILDHIKERLDDYLDTCEKCKRSDDTEKIMSTMNSLHDAHEIIQIIKDDSLSESVLRYMAPHLSVNKESKMLL